MWDYNCYLGHYYRWYRIREWDKSRSCVSNIHLYDFSVTYRISEEKESTDSMLGACLCCAICILSSSRRLDTYGFFDNNREQCIQVAAHAVSRFIARQSGEGVKDITIDTLGIAHEIGVSKPEIVKELLYQSVARGELPTGVRII